MKCCTRAQFVAVWQINNNENKTLEKKRIVLFVSIFSFEGIYTCSALPLLSVARHTLLSCSTHLLTHVFENTIRTH